jgi:hypothetical protein
MFKVKDLAQRNTEGGAYVTEWSILGPFSIDQKI